MQAWLDLVDEVIVVDSRSTDGTLDLIRAELQHPQLRIIERDRGLYASWNEGIAATTGDWVYISTAGDLITRDQLLHLREVGEALSADVVVSPPDFAYEEDGQPVTSGGRRLSYWRPSALDNRSRCNQRPRNS
jgi:glycosyltransferase involved in cell wall biosynthesis